VSRVAELQARRRALLSRCDAQREEIAFQIAELREAPRRWLKGGAGLRSAAAAALQPSRHPLAWMASLAGLMLLGRTREVLTFMVWTRSALALVSRVTQILGLVGALRGLRRTPAKEREHA
jgi:hypothetical protein